MLLIDKVRNLHLEMEMLEPIILTTSARRDVFACVDATASGLISQTIAPGITE